MRGFGRDGAVGLHHAIGHPFGHRRHGIADIDLAAGDVEGAAVKRGRFGQASDGVLGRCIGCRNSAAAHGRRSSRY
ncbi:MAG: hypothetical protein WDN69_32535 [Aliidongia sp.]